MDKHLRRIMIGAITLSVLSAVLGSPAAADDAIAEWDTIKALPAPELKSVTIDPKTVGVMVMDFGKGNCTEEVRPRCTWAVPNVKRLLDQARAKGMTIVFIRTQAMKPEDFVDAIAPRAGEPYLVGTKEDKLWETGAEKIFRDKGIDTLLLMGHQGNGSVMVTAFGAVMRGFKVVVPVDTMPAASAYQEQFAIWAIANNPAFRGLSTLTRSTTVSW